MARMTGNVESLYAEWGCRDGASGSSIEIAKWRVSASYRRSSSISSIGVSLIGARSGRSSRTDGSSSTSCTKANTRSMPCSIRAFSSLENYLRCVVISHDCDPFSAAPCFHLNDKLADFVSILSKTNPHSHAISQAQLEITLRRHADSFHPIIPMVPLQDAMLTIPSEGQSGCPVLT